MKKPEEIKKGLECCVSNQKGKHWIECYADCPYRDNRPFCENYLKKDAIRYIRQLELMLEEEHMMCEFYRAKDKRNCGAKMDGGKDDG